MSTPIEALSHRLKTNYPTAAVEITVINSKHTVLDFYMGKDSFEVDCWPDEGYGITKTTEEISFTRGCDASFASLEAAEDYLLQQIRLII